jgi:mRNA interferase RelE/StbE
VASYGIALEPPARRALSRLPEKTATAVVEFVFGALADNPYRVGKPLAAPFAGTWSARRGDYRVIYVVHDEKRIVSVLTVAHRGDVYARRF